MNALLATVVTLLVLVPIVTAINCYVGSSGTYVKTPGFAVCYSWTVIGASWKSGIAGVTCSDSVPSGYSCCSTDLCNGTNINGMNILMASVATIIALFRAI